MGRHLWLAISFWIPLAIHAQIHTDTNVVAAAEDAFGLVLGPQSLGLYSQSSVRGFDPIAAGNVRLDGLYFDQQGLMLDRLANRTRIRVGLSAAGFPWPAPTGIVDYTLRQPQPTQSLTTIVYTGPYDSRQIDVDGSRSLWDGRMGVAAGASYRRDVYLPEYTALIDSFAILSQWTADKDLTVRTFWGRQNVTDSKPLPIIYVSADQAAPRIPRSYFGQPWTPGEYSYQHYGVLVDSRPGSHWSLRAGIFRSDYDLPRTYTDLYLNTSSQGIANHTIVGAANQHYGSTSGEVRLSFRLARKQWRQQWDVGVHGRDSGARYGGSDAVDFGISRVGQLQPLSFPTYLFHPETRGHTHEYAVAAAYTLNWNGQVDLAAGIQQPSYWRDVVDPTLGRAVTSVRPWLYNASLAVRPTKYLVLFGALTRGLEDSGTAPANAINRGAVLGAARSSQEEAGVKYAFTSSFTLVATVFDIQKPYLALDTPGYFGSLGTERHRGLELSLAGELLPGLNVNAGAMLMSPRVAVASSQEPIGIRPVGQTRQLEQLGIDYRVARLPGFSLDCVFTARGSRMARADNRVEIAGYNTLDLGARYQMTLGHTSATLRVQVLNVTDSSNWSVLSDGGLVPLQTRRALAYLVVDL